MIYQALGTLDIMPLLSHAQIFTFLVFLTFYVPCLSTFAVMLKTLGRKEAWFSVFVSLASALLMAGIVRVALEITQHFFGFGALAGHPRHEPALVRQPERRAARRASDQGQLDDRTFRLAETGRANVGRRCTQRQPV
jgi:hypothetical protein